MSYAKLQLNQITLLYVQKAIFFTPVKFCNRHCFAQFYVAEKVTHHCNYLRIRNSVNTIFNFYCNYNCTCFTM